MTATPPDDVAQVDIAIIGGGIAGTSLAITMQRAGWSTAVIEREPLYRDRVRGEACHPWGVRELHELDLAQFVKQAGGLELHTWIRYRDREVERQFRWDEVFPGSQPEIGFNHPTLEETLLEAAADTGVLVFRPARATIARQRQGWLVQVEGTEQSFELRARFLVAADGKNSGTRKLWGAETVIDPPHHSMGGMLVEGLTLDQSSVYQGYCDVGFSMVFPQGNDRWRVYLVGPPEMARTYTGPEREQRFLQDCATSLPEGAFVEATPVGPLAFFPNSHTSASRIDGPLAVAIGDAAGAGDPTQGHGMSLVWRDVRELRDLLLSHDLADVPAAFAQKRRTYEHVLRTHSTWLAPIIVSTDPFAVALQAQVEAARAIDATALGYAGIFANGPDSLSTDDETRAKFFGEHLVDDPVIYSPTIDKPD